MKIGKKITDENTEVDGYPDSSFHIITECDWDCSYCIVDTHSQPHITFEQIKNRIDLIPDHTMCSITGGEPGLLKKDVLDYVIDKLLKKSCKICINTNGLFLRKYPEYYQIIHDYFYHCSENLKDENILEGFEDPDNKIIYMIVVTDDSYPRLESFLTKWSNVNMHVHAAQRSAKSIKHKNSTLSKKNAINIFRNYKHLINKEHAKYLLFSFEELNKCSYVNAGPDC